MSTHNICFHREIRKILYGYPILSVAMIIISARGAKQPTLLQGNKTAAGSGKVQPIQTSTSHTLMSPQHPVGAGSYGALSDTEISKRLSIKTGEKRQHPFTAEEIQDLIVSAESKRRKTDSEKYALGTHGQNMSYIKSQDKNLSNVQKVDNLPPNKQFLVGDDDSSDFYDSQSHHEQVTSHDGLKEPQFTHDNLEYQKFLKQYKEEVGIKFGEDESDFDEDYDEEELEEYELMGNKLEKGEIPESVHFSDTAVSSQGQILTQTSQSQFTPSQYQRQFQNFNKNNQNPVLQSPQSVKDQTKHGPREYNPSVENKEVGNKVDSSVKCKKEKDSKVDVSLQSVINKAAQKLEQNQMKQSGPAGDETPEVQEIKEELDPDDLDYKQSADSSTSGLKQQADSSNQRVETSPRQSEIQMPDTTQPTRVSQTLPSGQGVSQRSELSFILIYSLNTCLLLQSIFFPIQSGQNRF